MNTERPKYFDVRKVPHLRGLRLQHALARLTEQASTEETADILAECPDILVRLSRLERGEAQLIPIEEVAAHWAAARGQDD